MARTRAVPRWRPNINFQQRGNIDFERQRVAATRNISSTESSATSSTTSPARSPARSPLGNLVEVKHHGNIVRKMVVRRVAKHAAKKRNVIYR